MPLTETEITEWYANESIAVQFEICCEKIKDKHIGKVLLETNHDYLLHQNNQAKADELWGGKFPKGQNLDAPVNLDSLTGHNRLGMIWMAVRDELNAEK